MLPGLLHWRRLTDRTHELVVPLHCSSLHVPQLLASAIAVGLHNGPCVDTKGAALRRCLRCPARPLGCGRPAGRRWVWSCFRRRRLQAMRPSLEWRIGEWCLLGNAPFPVHDLLGLLNQHGRISKQRGHHSDRIARSHAKEVPMCDVFGPCVWNFGHEIPRFLCHRIDNCLGHRNTRSVFHGCARRQGRQ